MKAYQFTTQNANGLDSEDIRFRCPSVYAPAAHDSRSARYTYISTNDIIARLAEAGFTPTQAMQAKARDLNRREFTKHLLRFRRTEDLGWSKPEAFEIVLVNAMDGSATYKLYAGILRTVCSNGLIAGDMFTLSIPHLGDIADRVVEGSLRIVEEAEPIMAQVEEMKRIQLPREEQLLLAQYALKARYDLKDGEVSDFLPEDVLDYRRRRADQDNSLWTTTNVIQENVIKGGPSRRVGHAHKSIRSVHEIDKTIEVNSLLWGFAEELKRIHTNN